MSADESRRLTLDPGLTLARRSLHDRDGYDSFLERPSAGGWPARADDAEWLRPFLAFLTHRRHPAH